MANNSNRVQTRVPLYHKWIIEQLVEVMGRNEGDVLSRIIGQWVEDRAEWLEQHGCSFATFQEVRDKAPAEVKNFAPGKEGVRGERQQQ